MTGPAFRLPAPPAGWSGVELVRLVDPTGSAIAWLAPGRGAACVAFLVRDEGERWREVVGGMGVGSAAGVTIDGRATAWRLVSRDPTSCLLALERGGERGRLGAWLADACLWLEVEVDAGPLVAIDFGGPAPIAIEGALGDVAIGAGSCSVRTGGVFRVRVG